MSFFCLSAQDETRTHTILRPLPPQSSVYTNFTTCASRSAKEQIVCPEQDSNLHTSRHAHLKRTRLPIPPSGLLLSAIMPNCKKKGAENETRTRDPDLGKVVLYQLSYCRICVRPLAPFNRKRVQRYCFFLIYANIFEKKCKKSAFYKIFYFFLQKNTKKFAYIGFL